jgi:acyl-CoA synthetase (NDP forming)
MKESDLSLKKRNPFSKGDSMKPLDRIFKSQSIAIIGASKDEKKRGYQVLNALQQERYEGKIYPVNPKEETILGIKCYPSILDIAQPIDIVFIATPAQTIPDIIQDCAKARAAGLVIVASGFGETGQKGKKLENKLSRFARNHNMRIIGPNTSGMMSLFNRMNLVGIRDVPSGNIALLTQSGNIALHLITEARLRSQSGFSFYVGVGNEADLKFHEYLEYFKNDNNTRAIVLYVEGLREGRKFLQEAYKTTPLKPIILLKSGRSSTGKQAVGSHTGALAGISEVARTAFERAGVITIENLDELFPAAESLATLPPLRNNKVAILADGGGHASIASDLLSDLGIEMPDLQENTKKQLKKILPGNAFIQNPIDVAGGTDYNPGLFADCAEILLKDENIGGLLIVGLFGGYGIRFAEKLKFIEEDAAHRMGKLLKKTQKPIVFHSLYSLVASHPLELLRYYQIPVYESTDIACKCIGVLAQYGNYLNMQHKKTNFIFNWRAQAKPEGMKIIKNALKENRKILLEYESQQLLRLHAAPVLEGKLASSAAEAVDIAKKIGQAVAMKIVSPDILHKSDIGGVQLNLKTGTEVKNAFHKIMANTKKFNKDAVIEGCLVSPMVEKGLEIIIGTKIDDQFGPIIMFGLGGILVEVVKDVSFRVLPIRKVAARNMIAEIKSAPLLDGVRGEPPVNKESIINLLLTVSDLIQAYPEIHEMDLNPVIAHEKDITIVDVRIILQENHRKMNGEWNNQNETPGH